MSGESMIREVRVDSDAALMPELRRLYETAFPVEEQIPYPDLVRLLPVMPIAYSAWYAGDSFVGLTLVCEWPTANWFWYFAVADGMRGRGYGSMVLKAVMARYSGRVLVLDIESPRQQCANLEQRRRRHAFYLRHGLRDTGLERTFSGVTYTMLASADSVFTDSDYERLLAELGRWWEAMPRKE